ncbi:TonB-dependent receptor [Nevskia sp.]|uniref:TonB-dependent receptor domain-containing protein n=1 Tax=Nevskia sp. TaxID=1929292 RepID=UPI0025FF86B8|nr:TonB-dependent receptor [Nevskia sp.]
MVLVAGIGTAHAQAATSTVAPGATEIAAKDGDKPVLLKPVTVQGEAIVEGAVEPNSSMTLKELFVEQISVNVGGTTASSQKVFVNGLEENNLNVQIDGARQSNNVWHHNANTLIDPGLLKAVIIEAGVAAADAGPGAVGGSLRYETKDVADLLDKDRKVGAFVGGSYDSNSETFSQSGAGYGRHKGFEALGYVSHADGSNYEDGGGNTVQGTAPNLLSTLGKLAWESAAGDRIEATGQYMVDDAIRPYRANFAAVRGTVLLAPNKFTRRSGSLQYTTTQPTDSFDPELRIYLNRSGIERPTADGLAARGYFDSSVTSIGGLAQNRFKTRIGTITAGADLYSDRSSTDNYADPLFREKAVNVGLFTQLRGEPIERLQLSTGLRLDRQEYRAVDDQSFGNTGLSPNVSATFEVTPSLNLNAGYAYVFGGIPLAESGLFHSFPYVYSPDVEAQKARNGKLGAEYSLQQFRFVAELFSTTLANTAAYFEDVAEGEPFVRVTGPDLKTEGYNLSARFEGEQARGGVSFTHTDVEYNNAGIGTTAFTYGSPVGDIFKLYASYSLPAYGLSAGASSEIALKYDYSADSGNNDLAGYEVVNVYAEWRPSFYRALSLRVEANNLLDAEYVNRFSAGGSLGFISALKDPGRSIVLSTRLVF